MTLKTLPHRIAQKLRDAAAEAEQQGGKDEHFLQTNSNGGTGIALPAEARIARNRAAMFHRLADEAEAIIKESGL